MARAEAVIPALAGCSFRLADWHVRHREGGAPEVISEWYGWVQFDAAGMFDPTGWRGEEDTACACPSIADAIALPTPEERCRIQQALVCRDER